MAFQPADSLKNRTFVGLIFAQFLAGFNDQAIHAAAMFYALHQGILTEAQAISLMPILFYAPWAIFSTLSGYLADRYSKTTALRVWKWAEVVISLVLLLGFYLGTVHHMNLGAWIVLSTVFMMGTHAAFFAPAKYGAMPEILQPHVLSKGNGILESTTFLAAILGTVTGGLLSSSFLFKGNEVWIGVILLVLSLIGAFASLVIAYLPASNPSRLFPYNLFKPLWDNLRVLMSAKPLALSVLGIAFFIFMVAYMRSTMYMHGQTRNPPWGEFYTSVIVATVALGVGIGSPLAGNLSGGKIELGLVPLGCIGMIAATILAGIEIEHTGMLVVALVTIGFFSGFYMVPLYTLLQHRAPKASKGDLVATSNFINVTGAISASVLFYILVQLGQITGITPRVAQNDRVAEGKLVSEERDTHGHVRELRVLTKDGTEKIFTSGIDAEEEAIFATLEKLDEGQFTPIEVADSGFLSIFGSGVAKDADVIVSEYDLRGKRRYMVRLASQPLPSVFDNEVLPRYLFLGAAAMTFGILILLVRKLPDFFVRTLFWLRSLGRWKIKAVGMQHLPTKGPVLLATNADQMESGLQLVSATDRSTTFVLVERGLANGTGIIRRLAQASSVMTLASGELTQQAWDNARRHAEASLKDGNLLALTVAENGTNGEVDRFVGDLRKCVADPLPIVPVYCGPLDSSHPQATATIRVVFGPALAADADVPAARRAIAELQEWIKHNDEKAGKESH
ncbi:MAG: MFS transporter [Gemmataceae bacterium]